MAEGSHIIAVSGTYYFIVRDPTHCVKNMKLSLKSIFDGEVKVFAGNDFFFYLTLSSDRIHDENIDSQVFAALKFIWDQVVKHSGDIGPMPKVSEGNILDMIHEPALV